MGDQEKLGSSISDTEYTITIVKADPISIAADEEEATNLGEEDPLQDFEGFVKGEENDVGPLGEIGGVISPSPVSTADAGNPSTFVANYSEEENQYQNQYNDLYSQETQLIPFGSEPLTGTVDDNNQAPDAVSEKADIVTQTISLEKPPPPPKKLKKIRPSICQKCNLGFPSPSLLEHHLSTAHANDLPYACSFCSKRFARGEYRKIHETIHDPQRFNGPPQFACDMCDKSYHLKGSLEIHRKKIHFGYKPLVRRSHKDPVIEHHSTKGTKKPILLKKIFPCPHCDLTFSVKCHLTNHMFWHTKEKPFQCSICQQPYVRKSSLLQHIRKFHENPTPSSAAHLPPKLQLDKPETCNLCGKNFQMPSHLRRHMRVHTGEKPYECEECGMRFGWSSALRQHEIRHAPPDTEGMRTFKCRVCGKEGFRRFGDFRNHRMSRHRHIPWEGEKPFACGICGRPYYQRYRAVTCAILGHDPSSLEKAMFKHKCPECPPEAFGYHHLAYLRRHWEEAHAGKILSMELRFGMYSDNLKPDEFPRVIIAKGEAAKIREKGPPQVKTEFPLCIELELLPIPEDERFLKTKPRLGRGRRESTVPEIASTTGVVLPISSIFNCRFCERKFGKARVLRIHELMAHVKPWSNAKIRSQDEMELTPTESVSSEDAESFGARNTVNVNDEEAVRKLIGWGTVEIKLVPFEEDDDALYWAFSNGIKIRVVDD